MEGPCQFAFEFACACACAYVCMRLHASAFLRRCARVSVQRVLYLTCASCRALMNDDMRHRGAVSTLTSAILRGRQSPGAVLTGQDVNVYPHPLSRAARAIAGSRTTRGLSGLFDAVMRKHKVDSSRHIVSQRALLPSIAAILTCTTCIWVGCVLSERQLGDGRVE